MYPSLVDIPSDEEFKNIVESSINITEVTKKLGFKWRNCGDNSRKKIRERMKKLGITYKVLSKEEKIDLNVKVNNIKNEILKKKGNSKSIGIICEEAIKFALIKKGISVSIPIGENNSYDLIADINNNLIRIQVKSAFLSEDRKKITAYLRKSNLINKKWITEGYNKNEVDWFAIYCIDTEEMCFHKIEKDNMCSLQFRREKSKHHSDTNKLINDYSIEKFINSYLL